MRIGIVGAGHVGAVCGVCLSSIEHDVMVIDVDRGRIDKLRSGAAPFVEPGLGTLLERSLATGRLSFDVDAEALSNVDVVFLCVNTDSGPDGSVDLSPLESAVSTVAALEGSNPVLVNRSTAPVGTAEYIRSVTAELRGSAMRVAVNPEFLAEGTAIRDFLRPDRILIGAFDDDSVSTLAELYEPIVRGRLPAAVRSVAGAPRNDEPVPFLVCDPASAELAKYAANSMLAVKISFINEISAIAEQVGADVTKVADAVGLDERIGKHFLRAGIGWGGSCFPKDIVALQGMAETRGLTARMLRAANDINGEQRTWVTRTLHAHFKTLFGRRVGLLGLGFKPGTDDLRNAPALEIAAQLAKANVRVKAFDPVVRSVPPAYRDQVEIVDGPEDLARGSDALVVVTEWPEFRDLDLGRLGRLMRTPLLLDGRNLFDPAAATSAGLAYVGVGRGGLHDAATHAAGTTGSDGGSAGGRSSASDDRVVVEEASDVA